MSDYISRDELLKIRPFTCYVGLSVSEYDEGFLDCADEAREAIKNLPAADVAPVVHAKWIEYPRPHYFKCSNCKYTVPYRKAVLHDGKREYNSCPSCGAKMDLEG